MPKLHLGDQIDPLTFSFESVPDKEWLSDRDLAAWLQVTPGSIRAARARGRGIWATSAVRLTGRTVRYHRGTLLRRLAELLEAGPRGDQ